MVVAIDGPAGVGKSTISKLISEKTGMFYLNSGNFYRAVTYAVLISSADPENEDDVIKAAETCSFSIREGSLYLNGKNVEEYLHTDAVDEYVAQHSAIIPVRKIVNKNLRGIGENMDLIVEGRDITTVVFPDAEVKIYLDATIEKRAERRFAQGVSNLSLREHIRKIQFRDSIDTTKPFGSLKLVDDAFYIDTSDLTIDEVCEKVLQKIQEAKN